MGDDPEQVQARRDRLAAALDLAPASDWCWLDQVHGTAVVAGEDGAGLMTPPRADAAVTAARGLPLVVLTADCLPIVLAGDDAFAVVHAGWQGLLAGVLEAAVARLRAVDAGSVRAAIGPCAGPDRYEFGRADLDRMVAALGPTVEASTVDGDPALDLPEGARRALAEVGVTEVWDSGISTIDSTEHFSYRREHQTGRREHQAGRREHHTGRQALVAWIPA